MARIGRFIQSDRISALLIEAALANRQSNGVSESALSVSGSLGSADRKGSAGVSQILYIVLCIALPACSKALFPLTGGAQR